MTEIQTTDNDRTYTEMIENANATARHGSLYRMISPKGKVATVTMSGVKPRIEAGYRFAE